MPNLTFVHESYGTETEHQRAQKVRRKLESEKKKIARRYVVAPDFSQSYDTTRHSNGKDYIIRMPYKFREAPVEKPSMRRSKRDDAGHFV